jgi:hypothetical protein
VPFPSKTEAVTETVSPWLVVPSSGETSRRIPLAATTGAGRAIGSVTDATTRRPDAPTRPITRRRERRRIDWVARSTGTSPTVS